MKWDQRSLSKCACSFIAFFFLSPVIAAEKQKHKTAILPLITFYSAFDEGEVFNWWAENSSQGEMKNLFIRWYQNLKQQPLSHWEYPSTLQKDSHLEWQVSALSQEQKIAFAKQRVATLLVTGDIRIEPSPMVDQGVRWTQKLEVYRVKNGTKIAETLKIFDLPLHQYRQLFLTLTTNKEFMTSTVSELHEKIENYKPEKTKVSTKLILTGALSGEQMSHIQQRLQIALNQADKLPIVSYERNQVVFDIKGVDSEKLSQALVEFSWKDHLTQIVSSDSSQVVFDVQSKTRLE